MDASTVERGSRSVARRSWISAVAILAISFPAACGTRAETGSADTGRQSPVAAMQVTGRKDGELVKTLGAYTTEEFYQQFRPRGIYGNIGTSYRSPSFGLARRCVDDKPCRASARALMRSTEVQLDSLPEHGVVIGKFELTSKGRATRMYDMQHDAMDGYYLVVLPLPGNARDRLRANWRFVGVPKDRKNGQLTFFPPTDESPGTFEACTPIDSTNMTPLAGFEPCRRKPALHARAAIDSTDLDEVLERDRDAIWEQLISWSKSAVSTAELQAVLGEDDFAWTTCAAGCCRAAYPFVYSKPTQPSGGR